jgi:hypothetical protein
MALTNYINQPDMQSIDEEMRKYQQGGNVNLFKRPQIPASELTKAGWDGGDGTATVFSSTYTNRAGDTAGNFTPIMTDMAGNYLRTMSEPELTKYAESVMEGAPDVYGLRIGATGTLNDQLKAAERIHQLQALYYDNLNRMNAMGW